MGGGGGVGEMSRIVGYHGTYFEVERDWSVCGVKGLEASVTSDSFKREQLY